MFACCRRARAAEEESFENDLEQQLEDELKLDELMKHRQEPDKTCMVRLEGNQKKKVALVRVLNDIISPRQSLNSKLLYVLWWRSCCGTGDSAAVTASVHVTGKFLKTQPVCKTLSTVVW